MQWPCTCTSQEQGINQRIIMLHCSLQGISLYWHSIVPMAQCKNTYTTTMHMYFSWTVKREIWGITAFRRCLSVITSHMFPHIWGIARGRYNCMHVLTFRCWVIILNVIGQPEDQQLQVHDDGIEAYSSSWIAKSKLHYCLQDWSLWYFHGTNNAV